MKRVLSCAAIALVTLAACHRATEQECKQIIDRIVELELREQGITDKAMVEQRKQAARAHKHDELAKDCVGKRISKSALQCIQSAQTADEITDKCLR